MGLKERANKLKTDIPAVFMALKHEQTPWYAKAVAGLTIGYALSPIDLIPDFIPILGYLDDIVLLPMLVALTIKLIPNPVFTQCREAAQGLWSGGKPKKWYYAMPIVCIWLLAIWLFARAFAR